MDNRAKIIEIIQTASKRKVWPQPDESLFDSGLLDSFALTDMIGGLEAVFGISVPDSDLSPRKFDTIERIESYLESRR